MDRQILANFILGTSYRYHSARSDGWMTIASAESVNNCGMIAAFVSRMDSMTSLPVGSKTAAEIVSG
jgi:hypothetical protein